MLSAKIPDLSIIPRAAHSISRKQLSRGALVVLYRLRDAGFQAFLVGGGVRDLWLGKTPKDFDIATDAHPEEVKALFRGARLIGRRFVIVHVHVGQETLEVTTFRGDGADSGVETDFEVGDEALSDSSDEMDFDEDILEKIINPSTETHNTFSSHFNKNNHKNNHTNHNHNQNNNNIYGNIDQDAMRRDFTINALYYDINDFSVRAYAGGLADLHAKTIRLIGDPETRYREDPVRLLRAVRIADKLEFDFAPETHAPMSRLAPLLAEAAPARLFDEVLKVLETTHAVKSFLHLRREKMFGVLFPATERALVMGETHAKNVDLNFLLKSLANTEQRLQAAQHTSSSFLYACLLWPAVRQNWLRHMENGVIEAMALDMAASEVMDRQVQRIALPKRYSIPMREIWQLQLRWTQRRGRRPLAFLTHPKFRAAYDFMLLRTQAGEFDAELSAWWTDFYLASDVDKQNLLNTMQNINPNISTVSANNKPKKRRKKKKPAL